MKEVVERRLSHPEWGRLPDLMLLDGGKGHFNTIKGLLSEKGLDIPLVAIAKGRDELFTHLDDKPIFLPPTSPSLLLLKRIRDEAHRFAVSYHRKLRDILPSVLEEVPGIGPRRRKALLRRFFTLDDLKEAPVEELARVPGMNLELAKRLKEHLQNV